MMDNWLEFLKAYYQYVFIVVGTLYALVAYFDLFGINQYSTADSGKVFKRFIFEIFGEKGYKALNIFIGVLLTICGIVFLIFSK